MDVLIPTALPCPSGAETSGLRLRTYASSQPFSNDRFKAFRNTVFARLVDKAPSWVPCRLLHGLKVFGIAHASPQMDPRHDPTAMHECAQRSSAT